VVLAADPQRLRDAGQPALADDLDGLAQTMRKRVDRELIRARIRARIPAQNAAQPPAQGDPPGFRGGAGPGAAGLGADLPATLERVVRTLQRTPTGSRLLWDLDGPEALRVPMLSEDLMELLGNVLENAATWAASRVVVRVSAADPVVVRVEDDGPGVPEGALKVLGQRGLRLDERIPGSGLGLAIAQDICDAYGAELAFGHGTQGPGSGGLVVTLSLSAGGDPH
jgi:signal transduction histidine kinase